MLQTGGRMGGRVAQRVIQSAPVRNRVGPIIVGIANAASTYVGFRNSKSKPSLVNTTKRSNNVGVGLSLNFDFSRKNNTIVKRPSFSLKSVAEMGISNAAYNLASYNVQNIVKGDIQTNSSIYEMYHSKPKPKTVDTTTVNSSPKTKQSVGNLGRSHKSNPIQKLNINFK